MNYFSYNDYIDCTQNGKMDNIIKVAEKTEQYIVKNQSNTNFKTKDIENLKNKERIIKFLNKSFNLTEKFKSESLKLYKNSEIEKDNVILYKIIGKEIFIFIKVVDKRDYNISYKILNYSIKIIKKWERKKNKENLRYPIVIPIIIYTGDKEWKTRNNNFKYIAYGKNRINLYYNIYKYKEFIEKTN